MEEMSVDTPSSSGSEHRQPAIPPEFGLAVIDINTKNESYYQNELNAFTDVFFIIDDALVVVPNNGETGSYTVIPHRVH